MRGTIKRWAMAVAALALAAGVAACYLPARFAAEIEVSRQGFYTFDFAGYLVDVPLYMDLKDNKISRDEEKERVGKLEGNFKRNASVSKFSYYQKGHFKVEYKKSGDITETGMFVFYQRNENMISLQFDKETGNITVRGTYIKKQDADRIREAGLWIEGDLTLKTDARVLKHNATSIKKGSKPGEQILTWKITGPYDSGPKALLQLR